MIVASCRTGFSSSTVLHTAVKSRNYSAFAATAARFKIALYVEDRLHVARVAEDGDEAGFLRVATLAGEDDGGGAVAGFADAGAEVVFDDPLTAEALHAQHGVLGGA